MAPVKIIQVRNNYLPWMSNDTKNNIQLRNELLKKAKATSKDSDWKEYRKLRNFINNSIRMEKKMWQANKLESFGIDS